MSVATCERCGKRPAVGSAPMLRAGKLSLAWMCSQCLAAQARTGLAVLGGAALAAIAAGLGAALIAQRASNPVVNVEGDEAAPGDRARTIAVPNRNRTPMLNSFSRDLTQLAAEGRLDPVIGRDVEIERIVRILARRTKNNPVLIGDAGVGKTAIVEGLARRMARGDVPPTLLGRRVLALTLAGVVAGTKYRGEFEARMNRVLEELARWPDDVILFIDELHTIVGAGSAEGSTVDAANMLKPALARGELRCIGATTFGEYRRYIESDEALERRFAPIVIQEPTPEAALEMLRGTRERYERHHQVRVADETLATAVQLSARYIADRNLPDKAFDVLDEACAMVALRGDRDVGPAEIARIVAGWTGIPLDTLTSAETERLLRFEELLGERIVGQDDAVRTVAECVRRGRAGMKEHRGPMGALLFIGPTGVGKTELARATAAALFGSADALLRFDMSEFSQPQSATRLIGAPPGYAGYERAGELTEAVRRRPYSVVLFDDIDRAHPEVLDLLLQLLDDGRLTDAQSRAVDFRNALVILTATAPAASDLARVGEHMSTELLNRLDDAVVFRQLGRTEIRAIVAAAVKPLSAAAAEKGIVLRVEDQALDALAVEAEDQRQGARLVRRVLERRLSAPLARAVLAGTFRSGQTVVAQADKDGGISLRACDTS